MNFFGGRSRARSPAELVRALKDAIAKLESHSSGVDTRRRGVEEVSKTLQQMKVILYGDGESEPSPELVAQLAQECYANDVLVLLVQHLWRFEFEARKDVAQIYNSLLRRQIGSRWPTVEHLASREEAIFTAFRGYENAEIALNSGAILREMIRNEPLARALLYSDQFYKFIDYIEQTTFGIACDAQANFKDVLTRHRKMVAEFLDENYDKFFSFYSLLVNSSNYVTKRQSLKLLGEILLDRTNYAVMTRYIANEDNLKTMMNLLRDKSKNIQFEAFHVFKIFVANPRKPAPIEAILRRNKDKLLNFLRAFHNDRDDEQFLDEKQFLIVQIESL